MGLARGRHSYQPHPGDVVAGDLARTSIEVPDDALATASSVALYLTDTAERRTMLDHEADFHASTPTLRELMGPEQLGRTIAKAGPRAVSRSALLRAGLSSTARSCAC